MAKVTIDSGICGFISTVHARQTAEGNVSIEIESSCAHIMRLAPGITEVDPLNEIGFFNGNVPSILQTQYGCPHSGCPVFVGIIKAVEVAANLALPRDVHISVSA